MEVQSRYEKLGVDPVSFTLFPNGSPNNVDIVPAAAVRRLTLSMYVNRITRSDKPYTRL
jgi:hypothetical protein